MLGEKCELKKLLLEMGLKANVDDLLVEQAFLMNTIDDRQCVGCPNVRIEDGKVYTICI